MLLKSAAPADPGKALFSSEEDEDGAKGKPEIPRKILTPAEEARQKRTEQASAKFLGSVFDLLVSSTVAADGTYSFTDVKPGKYYLHATAAGYVDRLAAFTSEELTSTDPAVLQKIAAVSPPLVVTGAEGAHVDLRLERGGAISGRVLYDDGTPAVGWKVRPVHAALTGDLPEEFANLGLDASDVDLTHPTEVGTTDDRGFYRVAGLAPGEYVLLARLTTGSVGQSSLTPGAGANLLMRSMGLKLSVYSGNTTRLAEASKVSVAAGQEVSDYDLQEPLHSLHSVSGVVRAKTDGHPVNTGSVHLAALDEKGRDDGALHLSAAIASDGTYRFDYVPGPAQYKLTVAQAADATSTGTETIFGSTVAKQKTTHSYGTVSTTVALGDGDMSEVKLDVPETAHGADRVR